VELYLNSAIRLHVVMIN